MGSERKKVLFLIHDLHHGGAEKVLVNLVNNIDKKKFDVTVQTLFDKGINRKYLSNDVHYIPGFKWEFPGNSHIIRALSANMLYKAVVSKKYDIEIAYLEGTVTKILSGHRQNAIKKIAWVHTELDDLKTCFRTSDQALQAYRHFDQIICVSQSVQNHFDAVAGVALPNTRVLYNTIDTEFILQKSKELIEDVVFDPNEIHLISVGKLIPVKGLDRLIRAVSFLINDGYNVHLYLLGIGNEQRALEQLTRELNIEGKVNFLGYKENPYKYVSACDIYVCSSLKEGYSTAVTESLIVGTPVVSTCCSGSYELLGYHNEYGIVIENSQEGIYSGLKSMIENNQYKDYAQKALARGKEFSTEKTVRAVEEMLLGL